MTADGARSYRRLPARPGPVLGAARRWRWGLRDRDVAAHENLCHQDIGRWSARWPWSPSRSVVAGWQAFIAAAPDQVWANLHLDVQADGSRQVVVIGFAFAGRNPSADRDALVRRVGSRPVARPPPCTAIWRPCSPWPDRRAGVVRGRQLGAAAWLSRAAVARLLGAVADASSWSGERHAICDPLGGAVARGPAGSTAFPWRGAPFTVQWYAKLPLSHPPVDVRAAQRWVAAARKSRAPRHAGQLRQLPERRCDRPRATTTAAPGPAPHGQGDVRPRAAVPASYRSVGVE